MEITKELIFVALLLTAFTKVKPEANTQKTKWPRFIIAETNNGVRVTTKSFDPNTGDVKTISSDEHHERSLTANAYSNKVCHFHHPTYGIICHQNGASFHPDIPRSNRYRFRKFGHKLMSLSPFGDLLIFEEGHRYGVWIFSMETERARLLIPYTAIRYYLLEVDWDNGYLLTLSIFRDQEIQVRQFNGDAGVELVRSFGFIENEVKDILAFALDTKTMTAYWATKTFIAKTSYNVDVISEPRIIHRRNLTAVAANSFRFYNDGIFWYNTNETGPQQSIYRFDINSGAIDTKTVTLSNSQTKLSSIVVFQEVVGAHTRSNPCPNCSHICIPHRSIGYECTCPFEQPLLDTASRGVKMACNKPLTVWVIAEDQTKKSNWYLQSYDAMAALNASMVSTELLKVPLIHRRSKGYCTSVSGNSECAKFAGGSAGAWSKEAAGVARLLAASDDQVTTWVNGTCVKHQSRSKVIWTLYCNPAVDPDQVALDLTNLYVFYRNQRTDEVVCADLVNNVTTVLVNSTMFYVDQDQTMRLAVDDANQVLYWLSAYRLYRLRYNPKQVIGKPETIFDLDERGFRDQQLRFINGLLYWVQIRPNLVNSNENFIVRFNITTETQETFVKTSKGSSIISFAIEVPAATTSGLIDCYEFCSHLCRKNGSSLQCLCPLELPVMQNGLCVAEIGKVNTTLAEWPRFIIAETNIDQIQFTIKKFDPNKGRPENISSGESIGRSLTANAYSDKVCHYHRSSRGIICHQNGTSFLPELPKTNFHKLKKKVYLSTSLSPFGDHLIFEELDGSGIWIFNLDTQRVRNLIPYTGVPYYFLEVDWDNGYLLTSPDVSDKEVQVWQFNGDAGVELVRSFGFIENEVKDIRAFALDTKTMTAYWATKTFIAKTSYNVDVISEPRIIHRRNLTAVDADSFRFYNDGIFWFNWYETGPQQPIYRFDINSFKIDHKNVSLSSDNSMLYSIIVFEDATGAKDRENPCSKCGQICIPRQGEGYECTCPFQQPLLNTTIDGIRTECQRLPVWIIATETSKTSQPKRYLQTYNAMATVEKSLVSHELLGTSSADFKPHSHCPPSTPKSECIKFTGDFALLGKESTVARLLPVSDDQVTIWFNGTCVRHRSKPNTVWTLYCNADIDPDQVAFDQVNLYVFYRKRTSGHLVYVDLMVNFVYETILVDSTQFEVGQVQPMRIAVDEASRVLYYLTADNLYRLPYGFGNSKRNPETIFKLDKRGFRDQQLRFINGLLYWVQIRPNLPNSDETFIVRFNITTETQETFVKASKGFSIATFAIATSKISETTKCSTRCSYFCAQRGDSWGCFCPKELPDLKSATGDCVGDKLETVEVTSKLIIFVIMSTIFVVAILNAIGFRVYKRFMRIQANIVYNTFLHGDKRKADIARTVEDRAEFLPFDRILSPSPLKVHNENPLGEGNFGIVYEGEYEGRRVAVKTVKEKTGINTLETFFKELKIMAYVGTHQNIVEFIGAEVSGIYKKQVFAVLEFCPNGCLEGYLKKHRGFVISGNSVTDTREVGETSFIIPSNTSRRTEVQATKPETTVTVPHLCNWSYQIGRAMSFLTSKSIIHGDLATRNVLVFDDNILKVTDFGHSHKSYSSTYVDRDQTRQIPWKWMSPEALGDRHFSSKSDVWSYGVTLWEVFMFAVEPYADRSYSTDFLKELRDASLRLPKPELMPLEVYEGVFLRCFETDPEARIDFANIENFWVRYVTHAK